MALSGIAELEPEQIVRLEEDGPVVVLLDQRRLPDEVVEVRCATADGGCRRDSGHGRPGAPAIGIAAAYGLALAALQGDDLERPSGFSRAHGRPPSTCRGRSPGCGRSRHPNGLARSTRRR
jgi:Predicted translation initiation factor 2B subunit, eIF-2B alpha/beta/delta family